MKLRLHHMEMCVRDPGPVLTTLCQQFGLNLVGKRRTTLCDQYVVQLERTVFVITSRRKSTAAILVENSQENITKSVNPSTTNNHTGNVHCEKEPREPWTVFCCESKSSSSSQTHTDSVFNIAIEVKDLMGCMRRLEQMGCKILQDINTINASSTKDGGGNGSVKYAIVRSCCGNLVHTLIEKSNNYDGWFLPGFERVSSSSSADHDDDHHQECSAISYFDHVTLACHMGDSNSIIKWFQNAFEMRRFVSNRQESEEDGLVIGGEVGMRLKVLEFWKCSEIGLASTCGTDDGVDDEEPWEILKIVVVESLPLIKNTQVENFIRDHNGPGVQHIGLHTSNMIDTVAELVSRGVQFRSPPPTYYTQIGQLNSIIEVGVDPNSLSKYGILLDTEADVFDEDDNDSSCDQMTNGDNNCDAPSKTKRYLMQIFTYPIFNRDTFFLEVIQRKGAQGFGVGNVTALARSVNAYQASLREQQKTLESQRATRTATTAPENDYN